MNGYTWRTPFRITGGVKHGMFGTFSVFPISEIVDKISA